MAHQDREDAEVAGLVYVHVHEGVADECVDEDLQLGVCEFFSFAGPLLYAFEAHTHWHRRQTRGSHQLTPLTLETQHQNRSQQRGLALVLPAGSQDRSTVHASAGGELSLCPTGHH